MGTKPLDLAERRRQRQIALRPDVGSAERHQVVDVNAPRSEARNRTQRQATGAVRAACDRAEIERAVQYSLSETVTVGRFLPRQPQPSQTIDPECRDAWSIDAAQVHGKPAKSGLGRRQRDLLLEDDPDER